MIGIIGKKVGMTQIFNAQGQQIPCTVVEATPNPVVKVSDKSAGFTSVELGYGRQKTRRENAKGESTPRGRRAPKAALGHAAKAGLDYAPRVLRSFRLDDAPANGEVPTFAAGQTVGVDIFAPGERVKVTGTTKGRGFQGVVKRHGFGGGRASHGATRVHRAPGSIGAGTNPSRVIKGKRMPGHMGDAQQTVRNLLVAKVDAERNLLYVRGAVPGPVNGVVFIQKQ